MRTFTRTVILVLLSAVLAGCSPGTAKSGKAKPLTTAGAKNPAPPEKSVKLQPATLQIGQKPVKIEPPVESACKVTLSGFIKAELAGKVALAASSDWYMNVTTGTLAGKGYNARAFIVFKGRPAPGDYTLKDLQTAQFMVVKKSAADKSWAFSGRQAGGSFKMTLTSVEAKAIHGTITAALPPVARIAPQGSVVHLKITF